MYVMVPAVIRFYLADGTVYLSDEVRISLAGRRLPYRSTIQAISVKDQHVVIPVGGSMEVSIGMESTKAELWIRRDSTWVPTLITGPERLKYLHITNISDHEVILGFGAPLVDDERPNTAIFRLCVSGFTPISGVANVGVNGDYGSGGGDDPRSNGVSSGSFDLQEPTQILTGPREQGEIKIVGIEEV